MDIKEILRLHPSFTNTSDINQICKPLSELEIKYFSFTRVYNDFRFTFLGTNPFWIEYFLTSSCVLLGEYESRDSAGLDQYIWSSHQAFSAPEEQFIIARNSFSMDNGITLTKSYDKFRDIYDFCSTPDNPSIISWYANNLETLNKFVIYFNSKAQKIIQQAERKYIVSEAAEKFFLNKEAKTFDDRLEKFIKNIELSRYYLKDKYSHVKISRREYGCVELLSKGKSYKDIARILGLSKRTVEQYISSAKDKLGCFSKQDLVDIVQKYM